MAERPWSYALKTLVLIAQDHGALRCSMRGTAIKDLTFTH